MTFKYLLAMCMASAAGCAFHAHAGASLIIDDATITPPGRCQVEAWARAHTSGPELTAVPACTVASTEFSVGLTHSESPPVGPPVEFGAKHVFRNVDQHVWGIGASAGVIWNGARDHHEGWHVTLPTSYAPQAWRHTVLHANLGWSRPRDAAGALTGGVGLEQTLAHQWTLLAETYGHHRSEVAGQLGLRRPLDRDASLDLLLGHDGMGPWITIGLNLLLPN